MRVRSGLSLVQRTSGSKSINLASFHSPHSLTWSWILSLSWAPPRYVKPSFSWNDPALRPSFAASVGSIINGYAYRDNNGWQLGACLLGLRLTWSRQQPMWYRDLYWRRENERFESRGGRTQPASCPAHCVR